MLIKRKKIMRVTAISTSPAARVKSLEKNNSEKNPAFKQVFLSKLKMNQIENLYEDGPAMARMIKKIAPAFNEKFGKFFNLYLDVHSDFFRSIVGKISCNNPTRDELKKYIIENNKKIELPRFVIESYKTGSNEYTKFLSGDRYYPFSSSFIKDGEQKSTQHFFDFIKTRDLNKLIKEMYESDPAQIITKESSYLKHSTNIYGNVAV